MGHGILLINSFEFLSILSERIPCLSKLAPSVTSSAIQREEEAGTISV